MLNKTCLTMPILCNSALSLRKLSDFARLFKQRWIQLGLGLVGLGLLLFASPHALGAEWEEGFESPTPSWRKMTAERGYRLLVHERTEKLSHSGKWSERIDIDVRSGQEVLFALPVPPARVIDELRGKVWVRSDREGARLMVRVALPREPHPQSGQPLTTLLLGDAVTKAGQWQELQVAQIPLLLERQIQLLRLQGKNVDAREAYLVELVINVQAGVGRSNVWLDDASLAGFVSSEEVGPAQFAASSSQGNKWSEASLGPSSVSRSGESLESENGAKVSLRGASLEVDGKTILPRILEHRGESFQQIKSMGFHAVRLANEASESQMQEAARVKLGIVAPAPGMAGIRRLSDGQGDFSALYDSVWCWDLGDNRSTADLEHLHRWTSEIRRLDRRKARAMLVDVSDGLEDFGRLADVFLIGQSELRPLPLSEEFRTLIAQTKLARPGAALWAEIPTEPSLGTFMQLRAAGQGKQNPPSLSLVEMRRRIHLAIAAGARGLLFRSRTRVTERQQGTPQEALELLNLELDLLEPWTASRQYSTTASCYDARFVGAVLQANQAYLMLPLPSTKFESTPPSGQALTFVIPGVPESYRPYELTATSFRPAESNQRAPGGIQVTLSSSDPGMVLVLARSDDFRVLGYLRRQIEKNGVRAAHLARHIATQQIAEAQQTAQQLAPLGVTSGGAALSAALSERRRLDTAMAQGNIPQMWIQAARGMAGVDNFDRALTVEAKRLMGGPWATPFALQASTLPKHWEMFERVKQSLPGENLLAGGTFEDLQGITESGWRHFRHSSDKVTTLAELSAGDAKEGRQSLHLKVSAATDPPAWLESPSLWLQSPTVSARPGSLLRIDGWVKVAPGLQASNEGLTVFDSLTGSALGARFLSTTGWQPFSMYRIADSTGRLTVTCALTGLGECWLDGLRVSVLQPNALAAPPGQAFRNDPSSLRNGDWPPLPRNR